MSLRNMLLIDNPFRITPERYPTIWAGREDIKALLEETIITSLIVSPSRINVNHGEWGTGKTHSSRYFTQSKILKEVMEREGLRLPEPLCIEVTLPRLIKAGTAFFELYRDILDKLSFTRICQIIRSLYRDLLRYFESKMKLTEADALDRIKSLLKTIFVSDDLVSIFMKLAMTRDEREEAAIWRYILGQSTPAEIRTLGVGLPIDTQTMAMRALAGILNATLYCNPPIVEKPIHPEVFLWIDENETLGELRAGDVISVLGFYRDFLDLVPSNLTIFLNFSYSPGDDIRSVWALVGDAVQARVSRNINISLFKGVEDVLRYALSLLNNEAYRPPALKKECPDEFFPFTREALEAIFRRTVDPSPRRLNDNCSVVLEMALHRNLIKTTSNRIDKAFVEQCLPGLPTES